MRAVRFLFLASLTACGSRSGLLEPSGDDAGAPFDAGASPGHVLIFGGAPGNEEAELDDTWLFDGATWSRVKPAKSPQACDSFGMTGLGGDAVMVAGYKNGVVYHETWIWNGVTYKQKTPAKSPPHRFLTALAPSGSGALLFGGKDLNFLALGDTWLWNGSTWTELSPASSPSARLGHSMAAVGGKIVLFGGINDNLTFLSDTWVWDGTTWTLETPPVSPPGRALHSMATLGSRVVLFGGNGFDAAGASITFGDTWTWDGETWTKMNPAVSPPARDDTTLATLNEKLVLFGGLATEPVPGGQSIALGDTWTWDGSGWTAQDPPVSPPSRFAHGSATVH